MRNTRTSNLINKANAFIRKLQEERNIDYGVKNKIMTNEFVDSIKQESSKNINNIVKNCEELKDIYLENSRNFAKVAEYTAKM